jgi:hypothetical protein
MMPLANHQGSVFFLTLVGLINREDHDVSSPDVEEKAMTHTPLPSDLTALCLRAQRASDDLAEVRRQLQDTRAQAQQLIAQARQLHPIDWCASADDRIVPPFPAAERDPEDAAHETVHTIRAILQTFPLRWQIGIVKALGAQAALLAHERQQAPPRRGRDTPRSARGLVGGALLCVRSKAAHT